VSKATPVPDDSAARFGLRGAPRRWMVILVVAIALLTGGILAARGGHSGAAGAPTGSNPSGGDNSVAGRSGGSGANGAGRSGSQGGSSGGAANPGGGSGQSNSSAGSGSHASPKPTATPYVIPSPGDQVVSTADMQTSNCQGGYPPGFTCKVYVHGRYFLMTQPAGQLVVETVIDGKVAYSQTYQAPGGGHQFGSLMQFQVQQGAKEVDFEAILEDVSGKTLAASKPYVTYAR
jgi:hypothetical protein